MPAPVSLRLIALAAIASLAACDDHPHGEPTGATCPAGSTLSYETFGRDFMAAYCTRCHASNRTGADRNGAPLNHDFDSLAGILAVADHVDEYAAAGPDAVNTTMPPRTPKPTEAQRLQLGEWLACERARP